MATYLTGNAAADALLDSDPNALLIGMVLDQQVPMEKAFSGPAVIAERMGGIVRRRCHRGDERGGLRRAVRDQAGHPPLPGVDGQASPPGLSRAGRAVRRSGRERLGRRRAAATRCWQARDVAARLRAEKASIFTALLGKQRGVTPLGWRDAAAPFGEDGVFRSVADIVDEESLQRVRETKRAVKAAKQAAATGS